MAIEIKEKGETIAKIAENEEIAIWERTIKNIEQELKNLAQARTINEAFLEKAKEKLEEEQTAFKMRENK